MNPIKLLTQKYLGAGHFTANNILLGEKKNGFPFIMLFFPLLCIEFALKNRIKRNSFYIIQYFL